jgi:PAS domain S-box-containing protein
MRGGQPSSWFIVLADPLFRKAIRGVIDQEIQAFTAQPVDAEGNQARLREILQTLPLPIYTTDSEGRLTYCNAAGAKLAGGAPELGTHAWCGIWKMYLPDGSPLPHECCPIMAVVNGGEAMSGVECLLEEPDGTRRWFTPHPVVLRDAAGRITAGVHIFVDTTANKIAQTENDERKRAERAALLLSAIVDSSDDAIISKDLNGVITSWNKSAQRLFGYTAEETVGRSITILIPPDRLEEEPQILARLRRGERVDHFETIRRRKDGTLLEISLTISPVRDADGTVIGASKIARDITHSKRFERANRLLSAIVDSSDDAIISKDLNGIITSWNRSAERLFGYTAEEAVGKPVALLLIPPDRQDEEPKILARLRRGERVDHFETVRRRKDGALLDISLTISPVKDAEGRVIGASKIARDISERKRFMAALTASEARFRQLANSMPQIIWTARPDGYVDYYNDRWYTFTRFPRERLGPASWEPILHPEDLERVRKAWHEAVSSGDPFHIEHRFWDRHESRWRWFMSRALPARDELGAIVKWFGSFADIDEQKQVEDELRRANHDLEQFAYSASHDLQEPLRSVKIYSELLTKRYKDNLDPQALEFLGYLRGGATRMEMLVRDLLAYTQITRVETPTGLTDAGEVLTSTVADLSGMILEAGAEVTSGPMPEVPMHRAHLRQLLQNLIGNAIKYRSQHRPARVQVSAEHQNGSWIFSVADNGIGIAQQYQTKVFGLFKRLHTNDEYSGTGIGLAICQRIVDRYRGRIWVESELGQGATFRFTIPCEKPNATRLARILVVEDNTADVFLIREAIDATQLHADVQIVKDGEQATQFFDELDKDEFAHAPGLVILDLNLPKKHGYEVLEHMRKSQRCAETPVIVISTSESAQDRERAAGVGASRYLRKPSEYGDLLKLRDAVKEALGV